jgi:hypothetical protein
MKTVTPRTADYLMNRATSYEVALNGAVIGYTFRKTKATLLSYAEDHKDAILAAWEGADDNVSYSAVTGWNFGGSVVAFTGRTEREAYWASVA